MSKPAFTDDDFAQALRNLMPRGRAWNNDSTSVQAQAIATYAPSFRRSSDAALGLLTDAFPASTVNLLTEWESTLGLPDPCAGKAPTLQARRAQVKARFASTGGQSVQDFETFAAGLGYTVTVKEFAPFRVGAGTCGQQLGGEDWAYTWAIEAAQNTVTSFRVGSAAAGESLATWGNAVLECELASISPAHTILQFHYS